MLSQQACTTIVRKSTKKIYVGRCVCAACVRTFRAHITMYETQKRPSTASSLHAVRVAQWGSLRSLRPPAVVVGSVDRAPMCVDMACGVKAKASSLCAARVRAFIREREHTSLHDTETLTSSLYTVRVAKRCCQQ